MNIQSINGDLVMRRESGQPATWYGYALLDGELALVDYFEEGDSIRLMSGVRYFNHQLSPAESREHAQAMQGA